MVLQKSRLFLFLNIRHKRWLRQIFNLFLFLNIRHFFVLVLLNIRRLLVFLILKIGYFILFLFLKIWHFLRGTGCIRHFLGGTWHFLHALTITMYPISVLFSVEYLLADNTDVFVMDKF